jgi:hypothetical protein
MLHAVISGCSPPIPTLPAQHRAATQIEAVSMLGVFEGAAYLWAMKKFRLLFLLAASAPLFLSSCSQAPDAEKDPDADAAYKRSHRTEGYREAQRSNAK